MGTFHSNLHRVTHTKRLSVPVLLCCGALVGFGSAVTGTGGPVLLVPLLVVMEVSVLGAVGVSQAVQIPVAAFATAGYLLYGEVDLVLGAALGVVEVVGVMAGAWISHSAPLSMLRNLVAATCVGTGLLMLASILRALP